MPKPGIRIISDVHIWGKTDPLYRRLLNWMRDCELHHLVLLGDIFDVAVGSHTHYRAWYPEFFQMLEELTKKGTHVYYVEGNHDFHMKGLFSHLRNFHYLEHDFDLTIEGKKIFLSHGDRADKSDWGYRLLRATLRSWPIHNLIQAAPVELVLKVGTWMSRYSRDSQPVLIENLPSDRRFEIRTIYRNFAVEKMKQGFDYVVMGHCHDADELGIRIEDRSCWYLNVGYPRVHQTFVEWTPADSFPRRERLEF